MSKSPQELVDDNRRLEKPSTRLSARRVVLISNALDPPPDEGIRKFAHEVAASLVRQGGCVIAVGGADAVWARKVLVTRSMVRTIRQNQACALIYVPTQSATFASIVRAWLLRRFTSVNVIIVALQPRRLGRIGTIIARHIAPALVATPSPAFASTLQASGFKTARVGVGVDLERFTVASSDRRRRLREKYGFPTEAPVILHVGHARPGRSLDWLAQLRPDVYPVVVIGKSLGSDAAIVDSLRLSGVRVFDEFVSAIEELYQAADAYVFPVGDEAAAISAPLSVLEAMACNLPIVTTSFGALPELVEAGDGVIFANELQAFVTGVDRALALAPSSIKTRQKVANQSWRASTEALLMLAGQL